MAEVAKRGGVERSREGVPCWDGDASTFQEYSELAGHWEQSVPFQKRYLCGPRLQAELSGTARRFVMAQKPGWISFDGGVQKLLQHLRQHLGQPQLAEMAEHMLRYFKQTRRKKNEPMNEYITRKSEAYSRACQTLDRVQQRYGSKSNSQGLSSHGPGTTAHMPSSPGTSETGGLDTLQEQDDEGMPKPAAGADPDPWADWQRDPWWHGSDWGGSWWSWQSTAYPTWRVPEEKETMKVTLLPEFVQGWFLLQDAGLEAGERNMILAALRSDFSFQRVAQELRNQWGDDDLRRRDQSGRGMAWSVAPEIETDDEEDKVDLSFLVRTGVNEEGLLLAQEAEHAAEEALAMIEKGKRTLREARAKQHFVKMSRQFYRGNGKSTPAFTTTSSASTSRPPFQGTCLGCGKRGHKVADCPDRQDRAHHAQAEGNNAEAPFVCLAEGTGEVLVAAGDEAQALKAGGLTTKEVMEQGKAILDAGATKTLGSVRALEQLMALNQKKKGDEGVAKVDGNLRPVFGFGNSSSDQCLSTAWMRIHANGREGSLKVHTLDRGEGPILFSIEALRTLGAVIDYENDLAVFRHLDPNRVLCLERSSAGHQLLPMSEDWYQKSQAATRAVPSLRDYI